VLPVARRILVVEDDRDIRYLVDLQLSRKGYGVLLAEDGEEALRVAFEASPDVVVLDLSIPKVAGLDVIVRLRADDRTAAVPIVLLSASVQARDVEEGLRRGADRFVKKPFAAAELAAQIEEVLALRERHVPPAAGTVRGEREPAPETTTR